jgi:hypothetical protein
MTNMQTHREFNIVVFPGEGLIRQVLEEIHQRVQCLVGQLLVHRLREVPVKAKHSELTMVRSEKTEKV